MLKNTFEIFIILAMLAELYLCTRGSQHRKAKLIKGWNPVRGTIRSIEKKYDQLTHKNYIELTIDAPEERTVYAKVGIFSIYDVGEEVDLMEKNGVHRFRGNDRVNSIAKKELLWGTLPILSIIVLFAIFSGLS